MSSKQLSRKERQADAEIGALLEGFRPLPSRRFYEQMAQMPWSDSRTQRQAWFILLLPRIRRLQSASGLALAGLMFLMWFLAVPTAVSLTRESLCFNELGNSLVVAATPTATTNRVLQYARGGQMDIASTSPSLGLQNCRGGGCISLLPY